MSEHGRGGHPLSRILLEIAPRVRLLGRATPAGFGAEVARVGAAWESGREEEPRFDYAGRADLSAERASLEVIAETARRMAVHGDLLARLLGERAEELGVEAEACEVAGTAAFWGVCRRRFVRRDGADEEADRLADAWTEAAAEGASLEGRSLEGASSGGASLEGASLEGRSLEGASSGGASLEGASLERVASDDDGDPRSLVSAMRRAVGERRLPFRVVVSRSLAPLAATGDGVILVAAGRWPSAEDTARTVLHEVMGHAVPAARAKLMGAGLFEVGTAFGSDDQEGRALLIEERAGFLGAARRRELGLRHVAARAVEGRATFVDTVRILIARGAASGQAVRVSARAHRGGGLAREVVYLPAMVRVRAALAEEPGLFEVLGSGRVSVDAARVLRRVGWAAAG